MSRLVVGMTEEIKLYPPERKQKKVLVSLPEDQIKFLDDCAKAMGVSRSTFLMIYIDKHNEYIAEFVDGWLASLQVYQERLDEEKRVKEAKKMVEGLGQRTSIRRGH